MRRHRTDRRARRGFSLSEVLVTVGIIAVLTAVAVPSVLHYQRTLKYTELDDNARAIFVAAQNHLTALRSASTDALEVSAGVGRPAKAVPAGAVSGLESGTELKYVSTDVAGADPDWLVLPGSIESDLAGNSYLVEFDPASGAVYGVFYAERALDESAYQKLCQYTDGTNSCRAQKGRQAFARASGGFPVGYYGADGALDLARPSAMELPKPQLKLTNAEELVLEIRSGDASWLPTIDQSKVYLTVSLSDETSAVTLVSRGAFRSGSTATVVLDTLNSSGYNRNSTQNTAGWTVGGAFSQWVGDAITPGKDVTVSVTAWYESGEGEEIVALPKTATVTTNSLFAARSGDTVDVAYGRHLQNLSSSLSHLDSAITAARQTQVIDFARSADEAGGAVYSWAETYAGRKFSSIYNPNLTSYDGGGLAIENMDASGMPNGGLFGNFDKGRLSNIVLVDATVNGGLSAGAVAGVAGKNVGSTNQVVADNCQVYLTRYTDASRVKGASAGGLFGIAENVTIQNSFASTVVGNDSGNTGGLVGMASNVAISRSYAAGHLTGRNVGGLVGIQESYTSTITIEDSYAAGTIIQAAQAAGGMLGSYAANTDRSSYPVTVRRAYAAVDYGAVPADTVYGLIPPKGSCVNAYYLVKSGVNEHGEGTPVSGADEMKKSQALKLGSAFIEGGDNTVMAQPYNLPNTAENTREPRLSAPYPYPTLTVPADGGEETDLRHYGDWLVEEQSLQGILAYYEQVDTGAGLKTEFSYYDKEKVDGGKLVEQGNLDLTRTGAVYSDGYAFLTPTQLHAAGAESQPVPLAVAIGESAAPQQVFTTYLGGFKEDFTPSQSWETPAYYAYSLPNRTLDVAADADKYFLRLTLAGAEGDTGPIVLWLNPHFGRTAYNGYGDTNPNDGEPKVEIPDGSGDVIPIRSVRQFNNMRKYPSDIKSWTQELDLDGSAYKGHVDVDSEGYLTVGGLRVTTQSGGAWNPVKANSAAPTASDLPQSYRLEMPPITMHAKDADKASFGGAYDGGGHTIRNLSVPTITVDSNQYAALFYRLSSSAMLKNIQLADAAIQGVSASSNNYTGALAAYTEGTIQNCTVRNCTVAQKDGNSKSYVGGLVGYARKGVIGDSAHWVTALNSAVDGGAAGYVGGFAGYNKEATIQYSGARVEGSDADALYKANAVSGTGTVGGFLGGQEAGQTAYCYAAVKVTGKTSGGFAGQLSGGTISNSYAGGHTRNSLYVAAEPNVEGTSQAGGFLGDWKGGTLSGLCYTTCSAATAGGSVDLFAVASGKTAPSGCYAGGDALISGVAQPASVCNTAGVAVRPLAEQPANARAVAQPYDKALSNQYPHKPISRPDGSTMTHYGDWYYKRTTAGRDWVQQLEDYTPIETPYENLKAEADWNGDTLHLTFTVDSIYGNNQDLYNSGPLHNGVFCLTSDLGYRNIFQAVQRDGKFAVLGMTDDPNEDGDAVFTREEVGTLEGGDHRYIWNIYIPADAIPPYVDSVSLDGLGHIDGEGDKCIIPNIINKDPSYAANKVPHLGNDQGITIGEGAANTTESFQDWLGYEHQLEESMAPWGDKPLYGHREGAALGLGNKVYFHVYNTNKNNIHDWTNQLSGTTIGSIKSVTFSGPEKSVEIEGWRLAQMITAFPTSKPGTVEQVLTKDRTWQDTTDWQWKSETYEIGRIFLYASQEREEYEMEFDLDAFAKASDLESGDVFTRVTLEFNDGNMRPLIVDRTPKG